MAKRNRVAEWVNGAALFAWTGLLFFTLCGAVVGLIFGLSMLWRLARG